MPQRVGRNDGKTRSGTSAERPTPTLLAISSSMVPVSAASRICVRWSFAHRMLALLSGATNCSRSVWLSSTHRPCPWPRTLPKARNRGAHKARLP
jgi:hypothetical protein